MIRHDGSNGADTESIRARLAGALRDLRALDGVFFGASRKGVLPNEREQRTCLWHAFTLVGDVQARILSALAKELDVPAVRRFLGETRRLGEELLDRDTVKKNPFLRRLLGAAFKLLAELEADLGEESGQAGGEPRVMPEIEIPSDLLYQVHHALMPAERMVVVSGRKAADGSVQLGVPFDVTGERHECHVRSDDRRMARALIAMSESGTHLAGWFHSHPGTGRGATHPSSTDLAQYRDWLTDYSPNLLGAIVVSDGTFRLFGSALRKVVIRIEGRGVEKDEEADDVFHLSS